MWDVIVFLLAILVVAAGCLAPSGWLPPLPHDKWLHFVAFAGLTVLAIHVAEAAWLPVWLMGLLIGGWLIEVLQRWVPGRNFCWRDLAANAAGIAVAVCCAPLIRAWWG